MPVDAIIVRFLAIWTVLIFTLRVYQKASSVIPKFSSIITSTILTFPRLRTSVKIPRGPPKTIVIHHSHRVPRASFHHTGAARGNTIRRCLASRENFNHVKVTLLAGFE